MEKKKIFVFILAVAAIMTVAINVLLFKPFITYHLPSRSQTISDETYYYDWYTESMPVIALIDPLVFVLLPSIIAIIGISIKLLKKSVKKSKFIMLKLAPIANLFCMYNLFDQMSLKVSDYKKHGAYIKVTSIGICNILLSVLLVIIAIYLSKLSKKLNSEFV